MTTAHSHDLIIAGAGLVGASIACGLATNPQTAHWRVAVVAPRQTPVVYQGNEFDPRVVALTRQSQQWLSDLGVWEAIVQQRACPYTAMKVWDGEGSGHIEFHSRELHEPDLGHIVENSVALSALLARCEQYSSISFIDDKVTQVANDKQPVAVTLASGEQLHVPLVIAADGANSPIRQQLGFQTREWDYGHHAIVTTVRTELPHQDTAWQRFMHTGPLAFLPLRNDSDDHCSSIVWSVDSDKAEALMTLTDDAFAEQLGRAFEYRLGQIETVAQRFSFPLRQRHAVDYVQPGVALVGDAAHTIHPLAGQGVNLGFKDAQVLVAELARASQRQIPLEEYATLRRYQRQRKTDNLAMMAIMEGFKRLFASQQPAVHMLRNVGMRRVNSLSMLKNAVAKRAMGL